MAKRIQKAKEAVKTANIGQLSKDLRASWKDTDTAERKAVAIIRNAHKEASDAIVERTIGFVEKYGTYAQAKRKGRLNKYMRQVNKALNRMSKEQIRLIGKENVEVFKRSYEETAQAYEEVFNPSTTKMTVNLGKVSKSAVKSFETMPVLGADVVEETTRQYAQLSYQIRKNIRQGLLLGENPVTVGRRISKRLGIQRNHAIALARTNIVTSHNRATDLLVDRNPDIFVGLRWLTQLDERTCPICGPRHGEVYDKRKGEVPDYPAHFNCRCALVPVTNVSIKRAAGQNIGTQQKRLNKQEQAWVDEYGKSSVEKYGTQGVTSTELLEKAS